MPRWGTVDRTKRRSVADKQIRHLVGGGDNPCDWAGKSLASVKSFASPLSVKSFDQSLLFRKWVHVSHSETSKQPSVDLVQNSEFEIHGGVNGIANELTPKL